VLAYSSSPSIPRPLSDIPEMGKPFQPSVRCFIHRFFKYMAKCSRVIQKSGVCKGGLGLRDPCPKREKGKYWINYIKVQLFVAPRFSFYRSSWASQQSVFSSSS